MEDVKQKLMDMNIYGVVVSVIIERERDEGVEVLLQTRRKPDRDPVYSALWKSRQAVSWRMKTSMLPPNGRSGKKPVCG